jgi:hypothetical protein
VQRRWLGGSILNFASTIEAREVVQRTTASVPGLAEKIAAREPVIPF